MDNTDIQASVSAVVTLVLFGIAAILALNGVKEISFGDITIKR